MDHEQLNSDFKQFPYLGCNIQECVLPIIAKADDNLYPVGSGFIIQPDGLMMTASHVLDEINRIKSQCELINNHLCPLEIYAIYLSTTPNEEGLDLWGGLWPIDHIWWPNEIDIGFCWLRKAIMNDQPMLHKVVTLSLGLPDLGEELTAFGYYEMSGSLSKNKILKYSQNTAIATGKVIELHPRSRDYRLPFPCFHLNARFDSGMSGGPIFNSEGNVCGVVCSSVPPYEDGQEHVSYGSLLWPCLGVQLELAQNGSASVEKMTIYDLIQNGYISTDETISKIKVEMQSDGSRNISLEI
jgi:hypothetical protein